VSAQLAKPVMPANFLTDVNASGAITLSDLLLTSANLARALPPP
jgi:hypothetical protein